jgi:murein DD-endopeptidase MepM/ murein hydrolase activator NlpD
VVAAGKGVVSHVGRSGHYGNLVVLDHGDGTETYYAHLSAFSVGRGQAVEKGREVGKVGSTGRSSGPHLHFEVRVNGVPVNPLILYGGG